MSGYARWGLPVLIAACLAVPFGNVAAISRGDARTGLEALEAGSLESIAAWLKRSGADGYLAADVADAAGIPRRAAEEVLEAKQRGFRSDDVLRIAQIPADDARDFVLFVVQRPGGEIYFYLATVGGGLQRAFVSVPAEKAVLPIRLAEAQSAYRHEIHYWEARIAGR
jgi:hypothetical protein